VSQNGFDFYVASAYAWRLKLSFTPPPEQGKVFIAAQTPTTRIFQWESESGQNINRQKSAASISSPNRLAILTKQSLWGAKDTHPLHGRNTDSRGYLNQQIEKD
jgi:hypothetical protein